MFAEGYQAQAAKQALQAKGRLKKGTMNRTEKAYAVWLENEKHAGRVLDYWFEKVKFEIAQPACSYLPDFMVQYPDGRIELHEVKGSPRIFQDDAKVKAKACATMYPFAVKIVFPKPKKSGGGWDVWEY